MGKKKEEEGDASEINGDCKQESEKLTTAEVSCTNEANDTTAAELPSKKKKKKKKKDGDENSFDINASVVEMTEQKIDAGGGEEIITPEDPPSDTLLSSK